MSTDARHRGAEAPLPFGAGVKGLGLGRDVERGVSRAGGEAEPQCPGNPDVGRRQGAPLGRSFAGEPAAGAAPVGGPDLLGFLDGEGGEPMGLGGARALSEPVARALAGPNLLGGLEAAMGPASSDARFSPTAEAVSAALGALRSVGSRGASRVGSSAGSSVSSPVGSPANSPAVDAVAVAIQPSEPFAHLGARVLSGLASAPRVALIGHPDLPDLGPHLVAALLDAGLEPWRLAAFARAGGEALREAAARPMVAMDLIDLDPVEGLTLDRLRRLRRLAAESEGSAQRQASLEEHAGVGVRPGDAPEAAPEAAAGGGDPWFGLGAVDRPPAPILVRPRLARRLYLGVEADREGEASLPEADVAEAAEQAVEQAFGRGALGGFASDAATSVLVRPDLFSAFTACLLETLEETDEDPWFAPPPWVQRDRGSRALRDLAAGRRRVLDEGATLIHERRLDRQVPCGLVFTNVEPRMKLGGEMCVPGTLSLVRALRESSAW